MIKKDEQLFKTDIETYGKFINELKKVSKESDPHGKLEEKMDELYKRKFLINPDSMQSFAFKSNKIQKTGPKKEKEPLNVQQLLGLAREKRYSYQDLLKIGAKIKPGQGQKSMTNFFPKQPENPDDPYSIKLVKNEITKSMNMINNFEKKKRSMNNLLDTYKFNKLEYYDSNINLNLIYLDYIKNSLSQKKLVGNQEKKVTTHSLNLYKIYRLLITQTGKSET